MEFVSCQHISIYRHVIHLYIVMSTFICIYIYIHINVHLCMEFVSCQKCLYTGMWYMDLWIVTSTYIFIQASVLVHVHLSMQCISAYIYLQACHISIYSHVKIYLYIDIFSRFRSSMYGVFFMSTYIYI